MRKVLLVSGCSYTDKTFRSDFHPNIDTGWPKWPELLGKKLDMDVVNYGYCGSGNEYIYSSLLDHLTRGRVMLGVGPGALVSDAYQLGIDPNTQRPRMDESIGIIKRLLTEDEPITHESDWFTLKEARSQLKPYTKPQFPIAVAASQSPSGMVAAGKHGLGVLSVSVVRGGSIASN